MENLRKHQPAATVSITGAKGSGKSLILERIETLYPALKCCEGDVITIAARALDSAFPSSMTLGDCAKNEVNKKLLWEAYSKEQAQAAVTKFLPGIWDHLDYHTAFRGDDPDFSLAVFTDYKAYSRQLTDRTKTIIQSAKTVKGQEKWAQHVRENHAVLAWSEYAKAWIDKFRHRHYYVYPIVNMGIAFGGLDEQIASYEYLRNYWQNL